MAIDYDNQRKYLNSLIQQGGGKGEWAKQQAKKYSQQYEGFSLNDPTPTPQAGTQPSHQAWINNPKSGQGGMDNYVAKQQGKYNNALKTGDQDMLSRLNADMGRVGYSLNGGGAVYAGGNPNFDEKTGTYRTTQNTGNVNYWDENQRRMAEDAKAKEAREAQAKADAEAQAQAEALARQNAYNQSLRANEARRDQALQGIDSAYRESAQGLDNDYFQRYLMNQQQQVANGLNAGIAGDMDTRLGMARQGDLANIYRDTQGRRLGEQARFANESQRLQEALNLTDAEKLARTAQLRNMHEQQGFQNYLAERGMNMEDFFRTAQTDLANRQFNWGTQMDWANVFGEWNAGMPSWFQGSMPNGTVLNNYMRNGGGF
jgi:hypothetical protein